MLQGCLKTVLIALAAAHSTFASSYSEEANILQFDNVGYDGYYYPVSQIEALSNGSCSCAKDLDNPFVFSGALAPLNEELTVHFRGPMNLLKFGYYITDSYSFGQTDGSWSRLAYYDSVEGTADNVTFLANYGAENECLGNAFDYVSSSGLKSSSESEILSNTTIPSAKEFAIASGIKCNGTSDCGAYRTDGQAYHGFYGTNKMFLFEFMAPSDESESGSTNKTDSYDMPAIWLLNAHIPRTSQYPTNPNCSSWNSGSGEFDIFEVMNYTERNNFYSTIHDFQGTDDISTGLQNFGYLERTPDSVMIGGVIFGEDKTITVFLSNSTSLDDSISNSNLTDWVSPLEKETEKFVTLSSISASPPSTSTTKSVSSISSTKSKNDAGSAWKNNNTLFNTLAYMIFGIFYI